MREDNKKILLKFLSSEQPFEHGNLKRHSVLIQILTDCRLFTNRNFKTGEYDMEIDNKIGSPHRWLPAIGYLCVLDMIGNAFRKVGGNNPKNSYSNIPYALENFADELIDNKKGYIDALVALRNSFAHNLSLLNIPDSPQKKQNQLQRFGVYVDTENKNFELKMSKNRWDGIAFKKNYSLADDRTDIDLHLIGNLVEQVLKNLIEGIKHDTIEVQEIEEVYELEKEENGIKIKEKKKRRIESLKDEDYKVISFLNKYTFVITND